MRIVVGVIAILALSAGVASAASMAESQDAFAKRVGKYATTDTTKPKGLCWCKDNFDGLGGGEAGYVVETVTSGQVVVSCKVAEFNNGNPAGTTPCVVEWDMLGK